MNSQTSASASAPFQVKVFPEDIARNGIKIGLNRYYRDEGKEVQIEMDEGNISRVSYKASCCIIGTT